MATAREGYIDEFYETIRAPQFFDFCARDETEQIDSWFENKVNDKYDESSDEEEDLKFSSKILPDADFDIQTPPKMKRRPKAMSIKPIVTSIRMDTEKTGKSAKPPSERALQLLERQRAMTRQLKARRKDTKPIVAPKIVKKSAASASRTVSTARSSVAAHKRGSVQPKSSTLKSTRTTSSSRPSTTKTRQSLNTKPSTQKTPKSAEEFVFRALPLDRRVLESCGDRGVPKIAKLPITRPVSPKLSTARRSVVRRSGNSSSGDESNRSSHDSGSDTSSTGEFNAFDRHAAEDARQVRRRKSIQEAKCFQLHTSARASTRGTTSAKQKLANKTPRTVSRPQKPLSSRVTKQTPSSVTRQSSRSRTSTVQTGKKLHKTNPLTVRSNENNENSSSGKRTGNKTKVQPLSTRKALHARAN